MTSLPCPACQTVLDGSGGCCGRCGLRLTGPDAARLWQVDQQIAALTTERGVLLTRLREPQAGPLPAPASAIPLPAARVRRSWSGQQLLLGSGVLLLLVASVVFLAVAWSLIGVAGQVLAMAALTALSGVAARRLSARGLRASAEAFGALTLGLATLDVAAARALDLAGLAHVEASLYAVVAAVGLAAAAAGMARWSPAVVAFPAGSLAAAAAVPVLLLAALDEAGSVPAAVAAAVLLAAGAGFWAVAGRLAGPGRPVAVAARVVGALHGGAGVAVAVPGAWTDRVVGSAGGCAVLALGVAVALVHAATRVAVADVEPGVEVRLGRVGVRAAELTAVAAAGAVLVTAATLVGLARHGHGPALTVLAVAGAAVAAAAVAWRAGGPVPARLAVALGQVTATGAVLVLLGEWLTAVDGHDLRVLATVALAAVAVSAGACAAAPALPMRYRLAAAAQAAAAGAAAGVGAWGTAAGPVAVVATVAGLVTLAVAAWQRGRGLEGPLGVVAVLDLMAAVAAAVATGAPEALAGVLAAGGVAALAYAVLPGRGQVAVLGVLACSAATWTLSAAHEVHAIEAYSWPLAALTLLVGLVRLRRQPDAPSWATLGPALSAALLPSALASVGDPALLRPALVLLAGAALVAAGGRWRWQAPLVTGTVAVAVVAFSQLAPYAIGAPRWMLLAAVGAVLLTLGARYEQRRRDAEQALTWVRGLR